MTFEPSFSLNSRVFDSFEPNFDDLISNPLRGADPDTNFFACIQSPCESNYFSENSVNALCGPHSNDLSLFHLNIRSIPANFSSLSLYLSSLKVDFDVIAISETWLREHTADAFGLPCYKMESRYREIRTGGGVSILIKESLKYIVRNDLTLFNDTIESLFIEVVSLHKRVIIAVIYRPPGTDIRDFNDSLTEVLDIIKRERKICYIMGDFNIDLLKSNQHIPSSEFCELLFSHSFFPLISKPTRATFETATLIDNIFSNACNFQQHLSGILCTDISDHFPVFAFNPSIRICRESQTQIQFCEGLIQIKIFRASRKLCAVLIGLAFSR